jgi:hypothetical protein
VPIVGSATFIIAVFSSVSDSAIDAARSDQCGARADPGRVRGSAAIDVPR